MMVRLAEPHSDLVTYLSDVLNFDTLMVGPNQNFQWRCHTPAEEVSRAKLSAQSYLMKQLIKNLPMDTQELAKPHSARMQPMWILVPTKELV